MSAARSLFGIERRFLRYLGAVVAWHGWTFVTWDIFWELVRQFGLPTAAAVFVIWASMTGRFKWKRETDQTEKDTAALQQEWLRREAELKADRDYWRDKALMYMERWAGELEAGEAATQVATRVLRRQ